MVNNLVLYYSIEKVQGNSRMLIINKLCTIFTNLYFSGHPLLSGHLGRSQGYPLNTGFTVLGIPCGMKFLWDPIFLDFVGFPVIHDNLFT